MKTGRPRTSLGWATVSIRLPLAIVKVYRRLGDKQRAAVQAAMKKVVEKATEEKR